MAQSQQQQPPVAPPSNVIYGGWLKRTWGDISATWKQNITGNAAPPDPAPPAAPAPQGNAAPQAAPPNVPAHGGGGPVNPEAAKYQAKADAAKEIAKMATITTLLIIAANVGMSVMEHIQKGWIKEAAIAGVKEFPMYKTPPIGEVAKTSTAEASREAASADAAVSTAQTKDKGDCAAAQTVSGNETCTFGNGPPVNVQSNNNTRWSQSSCFGTKEFHNHTPFSEVLEHIGGSRGCGNGEVLFTVHRGSLNFQSK